MKGLTELALGGALLFSPLVSAEEVKPKFRVAGGAGIYMGTSQAMQDIYGAMFRIKGGASVDFSKNFRLEGVASYIFKKGQPYEIIVGSSDEDIEIESSCHMGIVRLEALAHYLIPTKGATFRIGGGLAVMNLTEKLEMTVSADGETASASAKASATAFGPVLVFGVDVPITKDKKGNLYIELSGCFAKAKAGSIEAEGADSAESAGEVDISGGSLNVGLGYHF